jgi:hypothetical protein
VGCTYSISLQIDRIRHAAEFVHPTGSGDITTGRYGVSQVPETYVVDGHGKVALHIAGPIAGGAVTREFQHALAGA